MYSKIARDLLKRIENTTSLDDIDDLWSEFNNRLGKWSSLEHFALYDSICRKDKELNNKQKNHFDYDGENNERVPVGCSACGGPYPFCKASCPIFDD